MKPGTEFGHFETRSWLLFWQRPPDDSVLTSGNMHVPNKSSPEARRLISGQLMHCFQCSIADNTHSFSLQSLLPLLQLLHLPSLQIFSLVCLFVSCRRRKAGILPSLEDLLFYTIAEGQEKIPAHKFTTVSRPGPDRQIRGVPAGFVNVRRQKSCCHTVTLHQSRSLGMNNEQDV